MGVAIPEPNQSVGAGAGLLMVKNNQQLDDELRKEQAAQVEPDLTSLGGHVKRAWEAARNAKRSHGGENAHGSLGIEDEMLNALRARKNEYTPEKYHKIKSQGGSTVYMGITDVKCTDAESWIKDVLLPTEDRAWKIKPTPAPDIPESIQQAIFSRVQQEVEQQQGVVPEELIHLRVEQIENGVIERFDKLAKETSDRMHRTVDDQFVEGGFYEALNEVIYDIVTFPAGIMRRSMKIVTALSWDNQDGITRPTVQKKLINHWYRVSPFDIYPAPDSRAMGDGYLIERHQLRRSSLTAMKGVTGYSDSAIDLVLAEFGAQGLVNWMAIDQSRADLENRDQMRNTPDRTIDAIEYHGEIQGRMLLDWGMSDEEIKDPLGEYEANVWVIGPYVIKATLNKDPLLRRPYFMASFQNIPGSFWGRGVPKKMEDVQSVCNGTARSLVNNVAISSGPQVEIFGDRIASGESITSMYPWKIWQMKADPTGGGHRAINFTQPNINAGELMQTYEFFSKLADDHTGIPPFGSSQTQQGAGSRAAAGIAMLLTVGAKGIKQVIKNIDTGIMEPAVERNYQWNMQFNPDENIKGDVEIEARGAQSLVAKEQIAVRRQEFLQTTANQFDYPLMGPEGRSALLREVSKGLDMPGNEIVPRMIKQIGPPQGAIPEGGEAGAATTNDTGGKPSDFNTVPNTA